MKVLITGDSHIGPIKRALDARAQQHIPIPDGIELTLRPLGGGHRLNQRFFRMDGSQVVITDPELQGYLKTFPVAPDIEAYGLSAPLHTLRLARRIEWKAHAPVPVRQGDQAPVSPAMLRTLILEDQRHVLRFIQALQRLGLRVFAIEPPGLFRHHQMFAEGVPAEVALFVDQEYRRVMRRELSRMDVPVVGVPAAAFDADGFTSDRYMHDDQDNHHGNVEFGDMMLGRIFEHLAPAKAERVAAPS